MRTFFNHLIGAFVAVVKPEEYFTLRKLRVIDKILCTMFAGFFASMLLCACYGLKIIRDPEIRGFLEGLPNFSYQNGELNVDGAYEIEGDGYYILIDTGVQYYSTDGNHQNYIGITEAKTITDPLIRSGKYTNIYLLARNNMVAVSGFNMASTRYSQVLGRFGVYSFNKQSVLEGYGRMIMFWMVRLGSLYSVGRFVLLLIVPLFYGLVGLIIAKILKSDCDFKDTYWMALYMNFVLVILKSALVVWVPVHEGIYNSIGLILIVVQMFRAISYDVNKVVVSSSPRNYMNINTTDPGSLVDSNGNPLPWAHAYNMQIQNAQTPPKPRRNTEMLMNQDDAEFEAFIARRDAEQNRKE